MSDVNVKFVAQQCENAQGGRRVLERFLFDDVNEAIEFAKKQTEGYFSWWEVVVEW